MDMVFADIINILLFFKMEIKQIRNATLKIIYDGVCFLIDPWFQEKGTGFSAKAINTKMQGIKCPMNKLPEPPAKTLKGVDVCLVTHMHFDHFSSDYLPKDLKIIAQNENDAKKIMELGFTAVEVFNEKQIIIGNVIINKTKAIHGDNELAVNKMGDVIGYVFESNDERTLYLASDTIYCDEVKQTIDKYHPKVIILNCCEATTSIGRLIMNLDDVDKVCKIDSNAIIIATHLDSVNHALLTRNDVNKFAKEKGLKQIIVPEDGESITI